MIKTGRTSKLGLAAIFGASMLLVACGNNVQRHYDILADSSDFVQSGTYSPRKVDILWVIDNSGSMQSSQDNLAASFASFINRFKSLNYDFHMAVTTTEAYRDHFSGASNYSVLRDGNAIDGPSGFTILNKSLSSAELEAAFIQNVRQGVTGSGDERAFHSMQVALENPANEAFLRPEAFLAVIIVSDEEDLSHDSSVYYDSRYHTLHTPESYVDALSAVTSGDSGKDFNVNAIAVHDQACWDIVKGNGQQISQRYKTLADLTGGVSASLCDNFGPSLELISDSIIELAASFKLDREPIVSSIRVTIDGAIVPNSETNGWIYISEENVIKFHGTAVPQQGSTVSIDFDPTTLKN